MEKSKKLSHTAYGGIWLQGYAINYSIKIKGGTSYG